MRTWTVSLVLCACFIGACATGIPIDETIVSNPARGSVYLARIPDRHFAAAHPIKLERSLIAQLLRGVQVREQQDVLHTLITGQPDVLPVFSEQDIAFLAPGITDALLRAAPDQQVGFRIVQASRPTYSEKTGAAVGSSEPPMSLSAKESTSGTLYAYGRSLYVTLSEYRKREDRPDTINMANRRVPDQTGLIRRTVLFIPETALRPDLTPPTFSDDGFGKTLVIDLARLGQASGPDKIVVPSSHPPPSPSVATPTQDTPAANPVTHASSATELEAIKSDMKKKDAELEALRNELDAIKRQLAEQGGLEQKQKSAPVKRPRTSSPK